MTKRNVLLITADDLKGALVLLVAGGMLLGFMLMLPKYIKIMDEYRGMQDEILAEIDNGGK